MKISSAWEHLSQIRFRGGREENGLLSTVRLTVFGKVFLGRLDNPGD